MSMALDSETLRRRIAEIPVWYHRIPLPGGIVTPGTNPLNPAAYGVPNDLTGKRVLDVGAWDGYWTFEALRRGAREAVGIDDFSDYLGYLREEDRRGWQSFDLCREVLGYSNQRCSRTEISIYDISEERLGRFDVAFCFGTLYHLRHPLLGLDRISTICDGQIFVESFICDDYSAIRGGLGRGYPNEHIVAEFYATDELAGNPTNWWGPTLACLTAWIYAAGFTENLSSWKLTPNPADIGQCRGFATGSKPRRA
jgi:tRNA (mo5U34)-methyltransferase